MARLLQKKEGFTMNTRQSARGVIAAQLMIIIIAVYGCSLSQSRPDAVSRDPAAKKTTLEKRPRDVAQRNPQIVQQMAAQHAAWLKRGGAPAEDIAQ